MSLPVNKQFTFVPDTSILPDEVNANFDVLFAAINNDVAPLNAPAFTGLPTVSAETPTSDVHIASKGYVDATVGYVAAATRNATPKVTYGTFQGSTGSDGTFTVAHGLGKAVEAAFATINTNGTLFEGAALTVKVSGGNSSIVTFKVFNGNVAYSSGAIKCHWQAYGGMGV